MKKSSFVILLLLISAFIYGQALKSRVGVLNFTANNISKSEAQTVEEMFTSELVSSGEYDVVDRKNIEALMAEMELQMSGCTDSSCAVEVGQILALDYMMYGSINKLGESFVINVYMINVETAKIEGTAKERFKTIEESYDIMPVVIKKLIEGNDYVALPSQTDSTKEEEKSVSMERPASSSRKNVIELGAGIIIGDFDSGMEIEATYRNMIGDKWGLGGGILLGFPFDDTGEPFNFGLNILAYFQLKKSLGLAVGFKGLPEYINSFGGPTIGVYFGNWYVRLGFQIMANAGSSIDAGYTIKL